MKIQTLEQALERIAKLEKENKALKKENKELLARKPSGRRKHDDKWLASYNCFVALYEKGLSVMEIADKSDFSRRTAYRYKTYYDELNANKKGKTKTAKAKTAAKEGKRK